MTILLYYSLGKFEEILIFAQTEVKIVKLYVPCRIWTYAI